MASGAPCTLFSSAVPHTRRGSARDSPHAEEQAVGLLLVRTRATEYRPLPSSRTLAPSDSQMSSKWCRGNQDEQPGFCGTEDGRHACTHLVPQIADPNGQGCARCWIHLATSHLHDPSRDRGLSTGRNAHPSSTLSHCSGIQLCSPTTKSSIQAFCLRNRCRPGKHPPLRVEPTLQRTADA
jgi:hypothetical protein